MKPKSYWSFFKDELPSGKPSPWFWEVMRLMGLVVLNAITIPLAIGFGITHYFEAPTIASFVTVGLAVVGLFGTLMGISAYDNWKERRRAIEEIEKYRLKP